LLRSDCVETDELNVFFISIQQLYEHFAEYKVNAARKSKVDDNTARMQSIKQLGV